MFGLLERDMTCIREAISYFPEIERAVIFGSRAMGNYKKGSDVDIAIVGESITKNTVSKLHDLLNEEYLLPYFFDVVHYESIANVDLIRHIDISSIVVYEGKAS